MPGEAKEPAHATRPATIVRQEDFEELRAGIEKEAFERLRIACRLYAKKFSAGITADDLEDVISSAISDVLPPLLASDDTSHEVFDSSLRKAINRHRKRSQRQRSRFSEPTLPDIWTDPSNQIEARDWLRELIAVIDPLLAESLERLQTKDRDMLIHFYGLDVHGYEKSPGWQWFTSQEAKKKALQRARLHFNSHLERALLLRLQDAGPLRELFETALQIVRGKQLDNLFGTIEDLAS